MQSDILCIILRGDNMTIQEIVNLALNSSLSVVVVAYFMFINYKFNQQLIKTLTEISNEIKHLSKGGNKDE